MQTKIAWLKWLRRHLGDGVGMDAKKYSGKRSWKLYGLEGIAAATISDAMLSCINKDGLSVWIYDKHKEKISENWEDCLFLLTNADIYYAIILGEMNMDGFMKRVQEKLKDTCGYKKLVEKLANKDEDASWIREELNFYGITL